MNFNSFDESLRSKTNQLIGFFGIILESNESEPLNSKNCEFIQVLIRRSAEAEKSSLRRLTILKQDTEKIAILDLNENDKLNDFSNRSCQSFKKHWSVCLKSHPSDSDLFEHLDIGEIASIHSRNATGNHNWKSLKVIHFSKNIESRYLI